MKSPAPLIAVAVAICAACSNSGSAPAPATTTFGSESSVFDQPLYLAVEEQFGYSFPELLAASNQYEATITSECLSSRGYEVSVDELVDDYFTAPTDAISAARANIDRLTGPPPRADTVPPDQFDACIPTVGSPIFELSELLSDVDEWVSDRVSSRDEMIDASARLRKCREGEDQWDVASEARVVISDVRNGALTADAAHRRLDEIEARDAERAAARNITCGFDWPAMLNAAVAEEQDAYLEQHPTFMADLAAEYAPQLEKVVHYLPSRSP